MDPHSIRFTDTINKEPDDETVVPGANTHRTKRQTTAGKLVG